MTRGYIAFLLFVILLISSMQIEAQVIGSVTDSVSGIGIEGVAVSNGRDVVLTDAKGQYSLPSEGNFIHLTRSNSFVANDWYLPIGDEVNFEVTIPQPAGETNAGIFFIQISDAHVFDRKSDFAEFSSPNVPWYMPDFAVALLTVNIMKRSYGDDVIDKLREVLRPGFPGDDLDDMWDVNVYRAYAAESNRENSAFGDHRLAIKAAIAEVLGFNPVFIINTGDLVLESNNGSADAIDRWFRYYNELTGGAPVTFYNTIGNNEIAGTQREEFTSDNPRFGKFFFQHYFGPTHFSFDYGTFHFVAFDTHTADPTEGNPDLWNFGKMEPHISDWARADLKTHREQTLVVLNHEPFHFDPVWPFEDDGSKADDESMFAEFGVDYVLSGHTHFRSYMQIDRIHHITTGALSGLRWVLPSSVHPRGYRLFYAIDHALYSAWKLTGETLIELAEPQPEDRHYRVVSAADQHGPFNTVEVELDGKSLTTERLGDFFIRIHLPDLDAKQLRLTATSENGTIVTEDITL